MQTLDELCSALKSKCGFDVVEASTKGQIRLVARVPNVKNWVIIMQRMRVMELERPWTLDLSQLYFLRTPNKKASLVKAWRLIIKADDPDAACRELATIANTAPTARPTLDEVPLPGGGGHRSYDASTGRGARLMGGTSGPDLSLFPRGRR